MSIIELVQIAVLSFITVAIFKIDKKLFTKKYFSVSQLLFDDNVTVGNIVHRIALISIYSIILNLFIENIFVILFGIAIGSFLIVWPVILNPEFVKIGHNIFIDDIDTISFRNKDYMLLLMLYFLFILSNTVLSYASIIIFDINIEELVDEIKWGLFFYFLGSLGATSTHVGQSVLLKKIKINTKKNQSYYIGSIEDE